jgi:hypothetical protein
MTSLLPINAATLIVLLANGSALAQGVDRDAAMMTAPVILPASQAAVIMAANAVVAAEGPKLTAEPALKRYSMFFEEHKVTITEYVHTNTIRPVMEIAQDTGEWLAATSGDMVNALKGSGEWIASGSSIVISATRDAGDWLASGSDIVVTATRDAGDWISSSSGFVETASRDAREWIASGSGNMMAVAQDASDWITSSSSEIMGAAVGTASTTFSGLTPYGDWSEGLVKQIEDHLRADGTSKFAQLVEESGFSLTNIKVGMGIIPVLDIEFEHERNLTPAEKATFIKHIDEYTSTRPGVVGFFEGMLLNRLLKAGEFSDRMRISQIHINAFPLPALDIFFDPLRHEEMQNKMIDDAYEFTKTGTKKLNTIEERISEIETRLSTPNDVKAVD